MDASLLTDLLIMLAPDPTEQEIERAYTVDKRNNPRNESNKPKLRDRIEIIIDYKIAAYRLIRQRMYKE